jgi:hypothetical protein
METVTSRQFVVGRVYSVQCNPTCPFIVTGVNAEGFLGDRVDFERMPMAQRHDQVVVPFWCIAESLAEYEAQEQERERTTPRGPTVRDVWRSHLEEVVILSFTGGWVIYRNVGYGDDDGGTASTVARFLSRYAFVRRGDK